MMAPGERRELRTIESGSIGVLQIIDSAIHAAIASGRPLSELDHLVQLVKDMKAMEAVEKFNQALAAFHSEVRTIKKNKTANITKKDGGTGYSFTYAELDIIVETIAPHLAKHGFTYTWDTPEDVPVGQIKVICILRHVAGHEARSSLQLPIENSSGMSPQQKVGSAMSFAQRRTLTAVLGLVTSDKTPRDQDNDPTRINDDQLTILEDLLRESGASRQAFLAKVAKADTMAAIRAVDFQRCLNALNQKVAEKKRQGAP